MSDLSEIAGLTRALQRYFEDRRRGSFDRVHTVDIV